VSLEVLFDVRALGACDQVSRRNIEGPSDRDDVRQGHVALAALDLTDVREMQAGSPAQLLLTPFQILASVSNLVAESDVGWAERSHSPRSLHLRAFPV